MPNPSAGLMAVLIGLTLIFAVTNMCLNVDPLNFHHPRFKLLSRSHRRSLRLPVVNTSTSTPEHQRLRSNKRKINAVLPIGSNGRVPLVGNQKLPFIPIMHFSQKYLRKQVSKLVSPESYFVISFECARALKMPMPSTQSFKQAEIVKSMKWAYTEGYQKYAFGADVLNVETMRGESWNDYDLGLTMIDSLDTLWLMGMRKEFDRAIEWIETNLGKRLSRSVEVNLFETTIRVLGGLLSAYHFTGRRKLLSLADDLGGRLISAFTSMSKVPLSDVNLGERSAKAPSWGDSSLSEVSTIQLEFKYLAKLTGKKKYFDFVDGTMDHLNEEVKSNFPDGILPIFINANSGRMSGNVKSLGARGDSYYEYLLKQWLLSNRKDEKYKRRYLHAIDGIRKRLVAKSIPSNLEFIGELHGDTFNSKMDHLVCFLPGLLALGYVNGLPRSHMDLAEKLVETCFQMYDKTNSKLSPEIVVFNIDNPNQKNDFIIKPTDDFNILRPETVESLMIIYHITKNEKYRRWGWTIFQAFEEHCKLSEGGYTSVSQVTTAYPQKKFRSSMESFFLAETLKYLFLLFSDNPANFIPLDKYVFNTEAHPIPVLHEETPIKFIK